MFAFSLILGLIFSVITILVVKDMRIFRTNRYGDRKPIYLQFWEILLLCLSYFIPILGIAFFIGFHIWFLIMYNGGDDRKTIVELNEKNIFHKIFLKVISVLTKSINQ